MTSGRCKVCEHPDVGTINAALAAGQPLRSVAARYRGMSPREVQRHRDECLAYRRDVRRARDGFASDRGLL